LRSIPEVDMKHRDDGKDGMKDLRRRAERRVRGTPPKAPPAGEADALKQLHELQVHQVELEMQNQELQRIREEAEDGLARYTALYDFAPVGYFTLDRSSKITRLNLTGARLLEGTRSEILGRQLADFVPADSRRRFTALLAQVFKGAATGTLELDLVVGSGQRLVAHVEAIADDTGASCRIVLVDVTARCEAERRADQLLLENRLLTQRMFSLQEAERRDLARELHDELGQWLTAIQAEAEAILTSAGARRDPRLQTSARAIASSAGEVHRLIRQMLHRLRPSLLDTFGLCDSLQELVSQWQERHGDIACTLEMTGDFKDVPESLGITVYRLVQEALTNAAKHSRARRVSVRLERCDAGARGGEGLRLTVTDDGRGLGPARTTSGLGLLGMRERAIAAGGEFSLQDAPRHGVQIVATLPLATQASAGTAR